LKNNYHTAHHFIYTNCYGCFYKAAFDKGDDVDSEDSVSLLSISSQDSVVGRMASTPVQGHPAVIDVSDVISSIRGMWHLFVLLDEGGRGSQSTQPL